MQDSSENPKSQNFFLRHARLILAGLALLVYFLFVTGDYFLPVKSPLWLAAAAVILVAAAGARWFLLSRPTAHSGLNWLKKSWPLVLFGGVVLVGGFLRWQAVKSATVTPEEESLAGQAISILTRSDWQPKSFAQPPLYLYLAALVGEIQFAQQAGAGKLSMLDGLNAKSLVEALRFLNLACSVLTLLPVYAIAVRLWSAKAGAVAAGLVATSWLAYQTTASLSPQNLGSLLAACSLFFIVKAWQENQTADFAWGGLLAGLATAATYGSLWLSLPLFLAALWQANGKFFKKLGLSLAAGLGGLTLGAPGWILSFNLFAAGVSGIGAAPENSARFYLKEIFAHDLGLLLITLVAFLIAVSGPPAERKKLTLLLAFPVAYLLTVVILGSNQVERLTLIVPMVALAATQPLLVAAQFVQRKLDEHDDRHKWGESFLLIALVIVVALISLAVRRFSP